MNMAVSACITAGFVFPALNMVAAYEERQCFIRKSQAVCLTVIMLLNIWLLQAAGCCMAPNLCSYAFLLVTAVIDEQTGGIYDCFGWFLIAAGALAVLSGGHAPAGERWF